VVKSANGLPTLNSAECRFDRIRRVGLTRAELDLLELADVASRGRHHVLVFWASRCQRDAYLLKGLGPLPLHQSSHWSGVIQLRKNCITHLFGRDCCCLGTGDVRGANATCNHSIDSFLEVLGLIGPVQGVT